MSDLSTQIEPFQEINSIADLPKIETFLFPEGYELLPNTSEVFELEFAFYEHKFLLKNEIVHRSAFFKRVDGTPTHHFVICSGNSPLTWEGTRNA